MTYIDQSLLNSVCDLQRLPDVSSTGYANDQADDYATYATDVPCHLQPVVNRQSTITATGQVVEHRLWLSGHEDLTPHAPEYLDRVIEGGVAYDVIEVKRFVDLDSDVHHFELGLKVVHVA